ncbi:hypothetical protein KSP40_PGU004652 [Platanthera guangdongensis]|uniref:Uncharacterized protein n=1 Tax=Platanthera guangdongensis TaxID=2320717 RepID=A0ABR2MBL1_9ASPA
MVRVSKLPSSSTFVLLWVSKIDFYGDFDGSFHKSLEWDVDLSSALMGCRSHSLARRCVSNGGVEHRCHRSFPTGAGNSFPTSTSVIFDILKLPLPSVFAACLKKTIFCCRRR